MKNSKIQKLKLIFLKKILAVDPHLPIPYILTVKEWTLVVVVVVHRKNTTSD